MYRRTNDIDRETRQALGKYDWGLIDGEISWRDYRKADNSTARNCALGGTYWRREMFPEKETDESIR